METSEHLQVVLFPVVVCSEYRGVFFGWSREPWDVIGDTAYLERARMAIYWGTTRGVMEFADTGPTSKSKLSAPATGQIKKITAAFACTRIATERWEAHE